MSRHIDPYANHDPENADDGAAASDVCVWVQDDDGIWDGECGAKWEFFADGPFENKWRFCPECGRPAKVGNDDQPLSEASGSVPSEAP